MRINGKTPREILAISSVREFLDWLPRSFAQVMILSAFGLVILAPLHISLKAPSFFDSRYYAGNGVNKYAIESFYTYDFDTFMHKTVFRYVSIAAVLTFLFSFYKSQTDGTLTRIKKRRDTSIVLFAVLSIWVLVNVFLVNGTTSQAMGGELPNHENVYVYLMYYLCLFPMGLFLTNREWKHWLLRFFALVSLVLAPLAIYLHTQVYVKDVIRCVFSNSNYYGIFLNVVIGLCAAMMASEVYARWRVFFAMTFVINTCVLYYNNTLAAWVGVFFACLFSILAFRVRDGKINCWSLLALVLFVGCLFICGLIDVSYIRGTNNFTNNILSLLRDTHNIRRDPNSIVSAHAGSGRWAIWKYYYSLVREHPWFGVGLDGVRALDIGQEISQKRPHNEYLQYAAFLGIPGLMLYFSACLSVYIRAILYRRNLDNFTLAALTAAFGYLVGAFFGNTVYNTTPYLYIMLGLGYVNNTLPLEGSNG